MRTMVLIGLFLFTQGAWADETGGMVCLGRNLAKPASEHTERLYLRVDGSPKISFSIPYRGPVVVADDLDPGREHHVTVYFDDSAVQSWKLDFERLQTDCLRVSAHHLSHCDEHQQG